MRSYVILIAILVLLSGCSDDDDPVQIEDGPVVVEHEVLSSSFIRNRFFRLTSDEEATRIPMAAIDIQSIRVFLKVQVSGPIQPGELENVAAFADSTGDWVGNDFTQTPAVYGARWRDVVLNLDATDPNTSLMADEDAYFRGIDVGSNLGDAAELAVTFRYLVGPDDWRWVGDDISHPRSHMIFDHGVPVEGLWYHMKLLKARMRDRNPFAHALMFRQVYSLAAGNIDPALFNMRIERTDSLSDDPSLDENGVPYLQIFGLDSGDIYGQGERDGRPDLFKGMLFDLRRGLLIFPESFAEPFDGTRQQYEANAEGTAFDWERGLFLNENRAPLLYDVSTSAADLPQYAYFRMVMEHTEPDGD